MKVTHAITIRKGDLSVGVSTTDRGPDALNNLVAEACRGFGRAWAIAETEWIDDAAEDGAVADMTPPIDLDQMPPLDG